MVYIPTKALEDSVLNAPHPIMMKADMLLRIVILPIPPRRSRLVALVLYWPSILMITVVGIRAIHGGINLDHRLGESMPVLFDRGGSQQWGVIRHHMMIGFNEKRVPWELEDLVGK